MNKELIKRLITSLFLFFILAFSYTNKYCLGLTLAAVSILSFIEFKNLIDKLFNNISTNIPFFKIILLLTLSIYLVIFSFILWQFFNDHNLKILILYLILVCVVTDIGGLIFGKILKGKKLISISPNKTYSGLIGAYIFSFTLLFFFFETLNFKIYQISIITFLTCSFAQLGDLFLSYLKRKANVKDTGTILPGHGGILDRIDGILIGVPAGTFFTILLS
jgi:phosphatidate cytidylyltransferase